MRILFGIYGASGHGRETMQIARVMRQEPGVAAEFVFIDDTPPARMLNGHRVVTYEEFVSERADDKRVNLAIGDPALRARLAGRLEAAGLSPFSVTAPNAVVGDDVHLGEGYILSPFVLLTCNIRVGRHFHANMHSCIAHDCVIGDYVTIAPGANCLGNVKIEDHAYIGASAVVRNGRPGAPVVVGRGAVIGMGAVVTRSVPAGVTVVGNPARPRVKGEC